MLLVLETSAYPLELRPCIDWQTFPCGCASPPEVICSLRFSRKAKTAILLSVTLYEPVLHFQLLKYLRCEPVVTPTVERPVFPFGYGFTTKGFHVCQRTSPHFSDFQCCRISVFVALKHPLAASSELFGAE